MEKYGEIKGLIAGTTTILGTANPARSCYESLARSIDTTYNDLGIGDKIRVATVFPSTATADSACNALSSGAALSYFLHIAEGTDAAALAEFDKLNTVTTTDGCLFIPQTTIVHGMALGDAQLTTMATKGMSLTWSPRSNVFLYGAGTDFSKTTNIPLALSKGINVSIAPEWSIGGSQNILEELRFAAQLDAARWGNVLSPKALVQMATTHPAKALGLDSMIGSIAVGKRADIFVIGGDANDPYGSILKATPIDVRLVLVDGVPLYGDANLQALGPASPGCETLDVCTSSKFICVAENGATAKIGQTFAQIRSILAQALTDYDALNLSTFKFSPLTPVVKCP
jgi:cytosine/adenosine deaminase-related metal-dependent hydrolase